MTTGNNYSFAAPNTNNSDNFLVKLDHRFDDRSNLSGRYIFGDGSQTFPLTSGNGSPSPEYQTVVPTRIQLFGLNLSQVLSNGLINKTRLGYNRFVRTFTPLDAAFDPASIGLVTGAQSLPTITITGFVSLGAPTNVPRGRVSLGLRYEYLGIFKEQGDRLSNFISGIGLTRVGDASLPDLYEPDHNNFAPRIGFAYDVTGKGRTILRGGYGVYYDTPSQDYFLLQGFQNGGPGSPATNPLPGLGVFNATFGATATIPYGPNIAILTSSPV